MRPVLRAGAGEQPQNERREGTTSAVIAVSAERAVVAVTVGAESLVAIAASDGLIAIPLPTKLPLPAESVVAIPADLVTITLVRHLSQ